MIKTTKDKITLYLSEKIASFDGIKHFFSTRNGGVSKGTFTSLNFGTHHGEADNMINNLDLLSNSLGCNPARFVIPRQTHTDVVAVVDQLNYTETFENTDALITNLPNLFICIKTADCVPILLFDPARRVIGAVHAGWRGTAQNIVGKATKAMARVYNSNPSDIVAAIGPCISREKYEVGCEVVNAIEPLLQSPEKVIIGIANKSDKFYINLREANYQLLTQAGVDKENIEMVDLCTYTLQNEFFSARRDGSITGRMLNGIGLFG